MSHVSDSGGNRDEINTYLLHVATISLSSFIVNIVSGLLNLNEKRSTISGVIYQAMTLYSRESAVDKSQRVDKSQGPVDKSHQP